MNGWRLSGGKVRLTIRAHEVAAPAIIIALVLAGIVPLLVYALQHSGGAPFDSSVWKVLRFTLWQASLSTILSIALAWPAARALAWRRFPGRSSIMALLAVPQALPAIVVVLALVDIYGAAGWMWSGFNLYGLNGILLAHVFFNVPLAIRFFVEALDGVAPENLRLADQLGLKGLSFWTHVEWPLLRPVVPRVGPDFSALRGEFRCGVDSRRASSDDTRSRHLPIAPHGL
jgi:thiamine transport system permease protein